MTGVLSVTPWSPRLRRLGSLAASWLWSFVFVGLSAFTYFFSQAHKQQGRAQRRPSAVLGGTCVAPVARRPSPVVASMRWRSHWLLSSRALKLQLAREAVMAGAGLLVNDRRPGSVVAVIADAGGPFRLAVQRIAVGRDVYLGDGRSRSRTPAAGRRGRACLIASPCLAPPLPVLNGRRPTGPVPRG